MESLPLMRKSLHHAVADHKVICPSFDQIAELMGVPSPTFCETYKDDVNKMKSSFLQYVKALRSMQSNVGLPFGIGNTPGQPKLVLETTASGFPILPVPLQAQGWSKQEWELLFTLYMGRHYRKVNKL